MNAIDSILFTLSFWLCLVQSSSLLAREHVVEATENVGAEEEFAPLVKLGHGQVRGLVHQVDQNDPQTRVYLYQGIRFATANRFGKPQPVKPWPDDYVYNATQEGNSCLQFIDEWDTDNAWIRHPTNHSEDCLFLDVYKPIKHHQTTNNGDDRLLPVMVWIYGGGFQTGTIYTPIYDCSYLASIGEVIVVAINYRLGPLGFLYGAMEDAPGNQGFYDQIMGLQWIQDNIKSFGGDPKQVTIFGESAGSFSVSALIISPLAKGLFQRAILQSGAITPGVLAKSPENSLKRTLEFGKKLDCEYQQNDMKPLFDCLRNKTAEEIVKAGKQTVKSLFAQESFYPVFDQELLPEKAAKFQLDANMVDLLFGVDHDEGTAFAASFISELMDDQMRFSLGQIKQKIRQLLAIFELPIKEEVVEFYTKNLNLSNADQIRKNLGDFVGDPLLVCPTLLFAEQLADKPTNQSHRFYAYRFDRRSFIADKEECQFKWMGVCHGAEISYVFGTPILKQFPEDQKLSRQLIRAWTGFAKTGQPGSIGNVEWEEAYSYRDLGVNHRVMALDSTSTMISDPFKESCVDLWAKIFQIDPKDDHHQPPEPWLNDVLKLDL